MPFFLKFPMLASVELDNNRLKESDDEVVAMIPSLDPETTSKDPVFNFNMANILEIGLQLGASDKVIGDIMQNIKEA